MIDSIRAWVWLRDIRSYTFFRVRHLTLLLTDIKCERIQKSDWLRFSLPLFRLNSSNIYWLLGKSYSIATDLTTQGISLSQSAPEFSLNRYVITKNVKTQWFYFICIIMRINVIRSAFLYMYIDSQTVLASRPPTPL